MTWLTRILGQVLLDRFLGLRPILPNLRGVGKFQSAIVLRKERGGVLLQPSEKSVLPEVEPIVYLRLYHPDTDGVEDLLSPS